MHPVQVIQELTSSRYVLASFYVERREIGQTASRDISGLFLRGNLSTLIASGVDTKISLASLVFSMIPPLCVAKSRCAATSYAPSYTRLVVASPFAFVRRPSA